jgi:6-phospho-3-hexuloisomerase
VKGAKNMKFEKISQEVVGEIGEAISLISENEIEKLINEIEKADKVFFIGVGRVLLSLKSIAKRLAHLGIKTVIVGEITEPAITDKDLLIVGSGSGESAIPLIIAEKAKKYNARVAHIGSNPNSSMKKFTDVFVRIPVTTKLDTQDSIKSIQPMTSLFEQSLLILGDIIALMMVRDKSIDIHSLWEYHANLE